MSVSTLVDELQRFGDELASVREEFERSSTPQSLPDALAWEKRFGPEFDRRFPGRASTRARVERCKRAARQFDVSYVDAKAAYMTVWDQGASARVSA